MVMVVVRARDPWIYALCEVALRDKGQILKRNQCILQKGKWMLGFPRQRLSSMPCVDIVLGHFC